MCTGILIVDDSLRKAYDYYSVVMMKLTEPISPRIFLESVTMSIPFASSVVSLLNIAGADPVQTPRVIRRVFGLELVSGSPQPVPSQWIRR